MLQYYLYWNGYFLYLLSVCIFLLKFKIKMAVKIIPIDHSDDVISLCTQTIY